MTEQELKDFFARNKISASINHYEAEKRTVYYAVIGSDHLPALLFIHGAPASMTIYKDFFRDEELLKRFAIYAVDRPGFGVTDGDAEPSIQKQANIISSLAERIQRVHQPLIAVAGSYGASIACRIAMDHPRLLQGLVLVAPSLGPGLEKMYWLTPVIIKTRVGKLVSKELYSASVEKWHHKEELEKMLPYWNKIEVPVFYLQSESDRVVYPSNVDFAKKQLVNVPFFKHHFFPGGKHDIDSKFHPEIRNKIIAMLKLLK
jgi:pimeloyl-ACP methyl ester carboxylesterase